MTAPFQYTPSIPSELDLMRDNGFLFRLQKLPQVSYFCQTVNLPRLSLGEATKETPFVLLKTPGDKLRFDELSITFAVQEDMSNFLELFQWMESLGFPENRDQFSSLGRSSTGSSLQNQTDRGQYSDATLFITNSDNVPTLEFSFIDCFPTSLSIPTLSSTSPMPGIVQANVSFSCRQYTVKKLLEKA